MPILKSLQAIVVDDLEKTLDADDSTSAPGLDLFSEERNKLLRANNFVVSLLRGLLALHSCRVKGRFTLHICASFATFNENSAELFVVDASVATSVVVVENKRGFLQN